MKNTITILAISLCLISWSAEDDFLTTLAQRFEAYRNANPQVSVHLLFNQDKYVAGDTAFFKAYFVNEVFRPMEGKQILELEVFDQNGRLAQKQSFRVVDGKSENQIILSDELQPGKYKFVAYSEWMKNFDEAFFFSREFILAGRYQLASAKVPSATLSFFAEGGHLVQGLVNKMIVKSSAPAGRVTIKNQNGEDVAAVTLDKNGLGEIRFTPVAGTYAELEGSGQKFPLSIETDGLALMLTPSTLLTEPQEVLLSASPSLRNQDLYMVATAHNKISFSRPVQLEGKESVTIAIPAQYLKAGLNQLFILDKDGNTRAERVFWKRTREVIASIEPAKEVAGSRELITLDIMLKDDAGNPVSGEGSISIVNKNLFNNVASSYLEYDLLLSDLPDLRQLMNGKSVTASDWRAHPDLYLIPMPWKRIPWKDIVEGKLRKPQFKFKNSMSLSGAGVYLDTQEPLPDSTLVILYLQKHMMGYEVYTTNSGQFQLPFMYDFWGKDQLFYSVEGRKKDMNREFAVKLNNHPITSSNELVLKQSDSVDTYGDYKFKKDLMDKSFNFYASAKANAKREGYDPNMDFEDELGGADFEVNAQEFLVFPVMEDMIREILPFVQHRKRGDKVTVRLILIEGTLNSIPASEPLFIIDGVMTKDTELFLNLKPADILTVKVVRDKSKLNRLGAIGKYGVILVQTKNAMTEKVQQRNNMLSIEGLSKSTEFKTQDYSKSSNQRVPDFRSTLLWSPTVKTAANGRATVTFYASDDVGPMSIRFQGITSEGIPFTAEKEINVAFQVSKN